MIALLGFWLTIAAAALSLVFGLIYFIRPKFMNYHKMALQKEWHELEAETQTLILALMRVLGSGLIAVAIAMIILQLEFDKSHQHWILWTILVIGTITSLGSLYAMMMVRKRTKGRPPIIPVMIVFIMLLAGFLFNIFG